MELVRRIPGHIGIIMDGNGRWAEIRGLPRIEGHRRGVERTKEIIEFSAELGIRALTLYAFSLENWQRPATEVSTLMRLLEIYLIKEIDVLKEKNIVFRTIGNIKKLPEHIQSIIKKAEEKTSSNNGMILTIALSYSGRDEILRAVRKIIEKGLKQEEITEKVFESFLDTAGMPYPDLIIRTSGEKRISNFLIWQGAYSEYYFTDTLWPDFGKEEFLSAIQDFRYRERRFGAIPMRANAP